MNFSDPIRSLWSGTRAIFIGSRKTTVVVCPRAELPARLEFDPIHGMESCSRWPELEGCNQACMPQVEFSAEELEDFTARYEGENCASCGVTLTGDDWYKNRLATLDPQTATPNRTRSLPEGSNQDHDPICSTCFRDQMH
jgi:hypothetical protein